MTILKRFLLIDKDDALGISYEPFATSTVPGVIKTDGSTLEPNVDSQFSVAGMKTKDGSFVYDWIGTAAEYQVAKRDGVIQPSWMCFITDDSSLDLVKNLQYAPFSINNGTISNGKNNTLTYSGSTLSCASCTVTNIQSRSNTLTTINTLDCSSYGDGTYNVFIDYTNGELSLYSDFISSSIAPSSPSANQVWLDTSILPATLYIYENSSWSENNNLVKLGTVTISSGSVTSVKNVDFNSPEYYIWADKPYQPIEKLSGATVPLYKDRILYYKQIAATTTFIFNSTAILLDSDRAYTFELIIYMPTVYSIAFPSTVKWQDDITPTMTSSGYYFFAFRTIDGGLTWKGSLQGVWV